MKEGNIIFLTRRVGKWYNLRVILSWLIAYFSIKDKSKIDTVATHTAVIFKKRGNLYVRDMDSNGNDYYELKEYFELYKNRIRIKEAPFEYSTFEFNRACRYTKVEYDFINLLIFQFIKVIFKKFIGKDTIKHRICSEDTARMFNIIYNYFENPEEITPSQIDNLTKNWKVIWNG